MQEKLLGCTETMLRLCKDLACTIDDRSKQFVKSAHDLSLHLRVCELVSNYAYLNKLKCVYGRYLPIHVNNYPKKQVIL